MEIYTKITDVSHKYGNVALALGMFDGLHLGHQSIIRRAVDLAKADGGTAMVMTFANHPLTVIAPDQVPLMLSDNETKASIIEKCGVDVLFSIPFTKYFSRIAPEDFLGMLRDNIAPKFVVTGANYTFGRMGKGNRKMLLRLASSFGFAADICPTVLRDGKAISSTRIREFLASGDLATANDFLGRPFEFGGRVVHGDRRGRTLGFPTANVKVSKERAMLPNGAYAVEVCLDGDVYDGLANIGNNPTFEGKERRLEVNIQNFDADIYDRFIETRFLAKLRDERKFAGAEELIKQLRRDRERAEVIWSAVRGE